MQPSLAARPVVWAYDHALRLYPPPDALVLADSAPGAFSLAHGGVAALNPGAFADEPAYLVFSPAANTAEVRRVDPAAAALAAAARARAVAAAAAAAAEAAAEEADGGETDAVAAGKSAPRDAAAANSAAKCTAAKGPVVKQTKITLAFEAKGTAPASPSPSARMEEDGADVSGADADVDVDMTQTNDEPTLTAWGDDKKTNEATLGAAADDEMALDGVLAC